MNKYTCDGCRAKGNKSEQDVRAYITEDGVKIYLCEGHKRQWETRRLERLERV